MPEITIPNYKQRIYIIRKNSAAWDAIRRALPIKVGQIILVSDKEFESIKEDVLTIDLPEVEDAKKS